MNRAVVGVFVVVVGLGAALSGCGGAPQESTSAGSSSGAEGNGKVCALLESFIAFQDPPDQYSTLKELAAAADGELRSDAEQLVAAWDRFPYNGESAPSAPASPSGPVADVSDMVVLGRINGWAQQNCPDLVVKPPSEAGSAQSDRGVVGG